MTEKDCEGLVKYDIVKAVDDSNETWVVVRNFSDRRSVITNKIDVNEQKTFTYDELVERFAVDYKYLDKDAIIGVDGDGWSIYKLKLREILAYMGAKEINGVFGFYPDDKLLDVYPIMYEGGDTEFSANQMYITEVDLTNKTSISLVVEPKQAGY